jgi:hypothetical protein
VFTMVWLDLLQVLADGVSARPINEGVEGQLVLNEVCVVEAGPAGTPDRPGDTTTATDVGAVHITLKLLQHV